MTWSHVNKLLLGSLLVVLVIGGTSVYFVTQSKSTHIMIGGVLLTVELAETPSAQQKGLSGRPSLPNDHGMLFVFDHEDYWGFWMIDMNFPLDIIWFNSNRQVVFMEEDLPPCAPQNCPVFTPTSKAMYVLEVNAGFAVTDHVIIGTSFTFLNP